MARISKEEKEAIRKLILVKSQALFFEVGYDKTSTKSIAKAVGIAEGTIFNYFKTKADILLEVIKTEYYQIDELKKDLNYSSNIVEVYIQLVRNVTGKMLKLPKKMLLEIFITTISISKKNPTMIKKLASLDFQFLEEVMKVTDELVEKGYLKPVDSKLLSESLFSILMYEMVLFFYEKDLTLEDMYNNLEIKFEFELKHYLPI